jgi:uncharacterized membrane protein YkoI
MIDFINAILKLHPNVTVIRGDVAYDAEGNEVIYDLQAVTAQVEQNKADELTLQQAKETAKASAISKLDALGLTQDEVKALVG